LVEFAFTFTVFLVTVLGTMLMGLAVFRYNIVSNLAQEGVRRASVCGQFGHSTLSAADCNIDAFVRSRALGIQLTAVNVMPDPSTVSAGNTVSVEVKHSFNPLSGLIPVPNLNLSSKATMVVSH
jgi:hypothetical protein